MERKIKVWLSILLALLIAAIAGIIVINNQKVATEAELVSTSEQLETERGLYLTLEEALENTTIQVEELEGTLSTTQTDLETAQADLETAQADLTAVQGQLETAQAEVETLTTQLTEKTTELETAQADLTTAQSEIETLSAQVTELTTELETAQAEVETLTTQLAEKETELNALSTTDAEKATEIERLQGEVTGLSAQLESLGVEIDALQLSQEVGEAVETIAADQQALAGIMTEIETCRTELENLYTSAPADVAEEAVAAAPAAEEVEALIAHIEEIRGDISAIVEGKEETTEQEKLTQLTELAGELDTAVVEMGVILDTMHEAHTGLTSATATIGEKETALVEANTAVESLQTQIEDQNTLIAELQQQIDDANAALASEPDPAELQEQIEALMGQLETEQNNLATLQQQLTDATTLYTTTLNELRAYRIERAPGEGEGHAASRISSVMFVEADGKTGTIVLANNVESSTNFIFEIRLDGETIFTSDVIKPGESLEGFELAEPLAVGNYDAMAVQKNYATDGEYVSGISVPVLLIVG